jgi:hypothetical protein
MREAELIPGPNASAREIEVSARLDSTSFGHPAGIAGLRVPTPP